MRKAKKQEEWNDRDVYVLSKCAGKISPEKIAEILGVDVTRITHKARAQGFSLAYKHNKRNSHA